MSDNPTTTIVIFGATGDLTKRKLIPALYTLYRKERLPDDFQIVGFSRTDWDSAEFRKQMEAALQEFGNDSFTKSAWKAFGPRLHYVSGNTTEPKAYKKLKKYLEDIESDNANRMYYLSVPPRIFPPIVHNLYEQDMTKEESGWRRVIVEKPFGHDLKSAEALNASLHEVLDESQIYRIDHYLAKETVQNILVFRFGNTIFEPVWNRNYIESVQITAAESVDVGRRAGYYDTSGVLRDMFQNHLLQLLTLVAMEPPASFAADAIRNEKVKVFSAVRPMSHDDIADNTIRAQYLDYQQAEGVAERSKTPTYAALRLYVDNWRWQGVPFYLRSGKALAEKKTEITINFKSPPHMMFPLPADYEIHSNLLSICVQPDEGIHLRMEAKVPDTTAEMRSVDLEFHYADSFGQGAIPAAYERLLLEALNGDASLFTRGDSIEMAWGIIDPILQTWNEENRPSLSFYERGTWGPESAEKLLAESGHTWTMGCGNHD